MKTSSKLFIVGLVAVLVLVIGYMFIADKWLRIETKLTDKSVVLVDKTNKLNHQIFEGKLYITKLGYAFLDSASKEKYDDCMAKIDSVVFTIKNHKDSDIINNIEEFENLLAFYVSHYKFLPNRARSEYWYEYYSRVLTNAKEEYAIYSNIDTDCHELFDRYTLRWIDGYNKYAEAVSEVEKAQAKLQKEIERMRTLQKTNQ